MAFPLDELRSDCIPSDDEQNAGDSGVRHSFTDRRNNGVIGDANAVCGGITHAAHEAALDSSVQKGLLGSVLVVGQLLFTVAERDLKTELVGINLFLGKRITARSSLR